MSNLSVEFFDKEYSIPSDVVTYVGLVDFTNGIRDNLVASFKKQIWPSIDVIESDNFMFPAINDQVAKFVRKLLENDIYDRTANDYLHGNKGYELFLDTKKKVLRQIISIRQEKFDTYRAGVEGAIYRKEASVTGLDFGIISSSFVNHMIYAYMDASKQTKQEQEALKTYNREIAELDKQAAEYDRQENAYIADNVIPAMNTVFTFFAYELLDKYVSDLIKAGKFDKAALDFINLERSNDLLENINLAGNKRAVIESAFVACPFNMAVYMHAMKLEMLDEDTFETANVFKQGSKIITFLKESLGAADYPNFVEPNYYSASLLARYTNKSTNDVLYQHTSSYANAVIREYGKIVKALDNSNHCREYLRKLNDDEILTGEGTSKRLAKSLLYSIAPNNNWNILVKQCGHTDLLERLLAIMPTGSTFSNKADCDSYLSEALFNALEAARKDLAQRILESRARVEAERQKLEAQKRKKRIKTTAILCAIVAVIIVAISLPSIIENAKTSKRESYVEEQIQAVIVPLEREMEDATGVDVIIDYFFSLEEDWDYDSEQWYEWTFSVSLPIFEEYRKSNSTSEQSLLEVMDVCKTLVEIYDDVYDDLDFEFRHEDARIVMRFYGGNFGSLKIHDTSTTETFYYEEYGGDRYLHSYDTEYVLDKNSEVVQAAEKEAAYNEALSLMTAQKYNEAIDIFAKLSGYKDSAIKKTECENAIIELKYNEALALMSAQKYDDAIIIFTELGEYKNSAAKIIECTDAIAAVIELKYNEASSLIADGKYSDALLLLDEIGDYKDAVVLKQKCALLACEPGDVITFGAYEQDNNLDNGAEAIDWVVLERDGNKALVISKYCIEWLPFHNTFTEVGWKNSSIRSWLNNTFLNAAFTTQEKKSIISTQHTNPDFYDDSESERNWLGTTTDTIFLLSSGEADKYFSSDYDRQAEGTEYACAKGKSASWYWWLRSANSIKYAGFVSEGELGYGEEVDRNMGIRPAMWIEINMDN